MLPKLRPPLGSPCRLKPGGGAAAPAPDAPPPNAGLVSALADDAEVWPGLNAGPAPAAPRDTPGAQLASAAVKPPRKGKASAPASEGAGSPNPRPRPRSLALLALPERDALTAAAKRD